MTGLSENRPPIQIYCDLAQKLNFACHQNAFAVLRDLRIENTDAHVKYENLTGSSYSRDYFAD